MIDPIFIMLWVVYHLALFAYFNYRLNKEQRDRERREQARRERLMALGFRPPGRAVSELKEETVFLA